MATHSSILENLHGQSLAVCSPWGRKESETPEQLTAQHSIRSEMFPPQSSIMVLFNSSVIDLQWCASFRGLQQSDSEYIYIIIYII